MSAFTPTDIEVRVRLSADYYNTLMSKYIDSIRMGRKCAKEELNKLMIISIYIEMLKEYIPLICIDPLNSSTDYDNNCISEETLQVMSDKLSKLIETPFNPAGYNYSGVPAGNVGVGSMQIGCNFIVS